MDYVLCFLDSGNSKSCNNSILECLHILSFYARVCDLGVDEGAQVIFCGCCHCLNCLFAVAIHIWQAIPLIPTMIRSFRIK